MDSERFIKGLIFYLLAVLYLFIGFGSIYGLFVDEVTIFQLTMTGWSKNLLCLFGLMLVGIVSAYPVVLAVYRAVKNNAQNINQNT